MTTQDDQGGTSVTAGRGLALVTGANSGIGFELAAQFAEHGFDVVVSAEEEGIHRAAERLACLNGGKVTAVRTDLRRPDGVERLLGSLPADRPVAVAALNTVQCVEGTFVDTALPAELDLIFAAVTSTVHLAKRLLPGMVARNTGTLLITSPMASAVPGSFQAVNDASQAFLQSFARAVQRELLGTRVTVTAMLGPTRTNDGLSASGIDQPLNDDPARVAQRTVHALLAGTPQPRAQQETAQVPDRARARMHRRLAEPGAGVPPKARG